MAVINPRWRTPRAAYVHVPFCRHRCGYCNFTLVAGRDDLIARYLSALGAELSALGRPRPVTTLFLGGGTPSHLPLPPLRRLLELVSHWFPVESGGEFSIEVNPVDLTREKAQVLADLGVNRVSLGGQSFHPQKLRILERDHGPDQLVAAYELARRFVSAVSIDLIFATPGETSAVWRTDLRRALALCPSHLSTYALTFERGTRFWSRLASGELTRVSEEIEQRMYAEAIEQLTTRGNLEHYEVSNFAQPGFACRQHLAYWTGQTYFAAGPGAARHVAGRRETNHRSPFTWLRRIEQGESPVAEAEFLSCSAAAKERLAVGLRLLAGIDTLRFESETGTRIASLCPRLAELRALGFLEFHQGRLRLTRNGLWLADSVSAALLE